MSIAQRRTQTRQTLVFPFERTARITGGLIFQELFEHLQDRRVFFSARRRPPPGRRICSVASIASNARRPFAMVLMLNPVMSAR